MAAGNAGFDQAASDYWATCGWYESARLHLQHFAFQLRNGYHLHESISEATRQSPNLRVADIGCANGIWLLELSKQLPPTAIFQGFDISPNHFPHPTWLPPNISFTTLDILSPDLPSSVRASFDILNARAIISILPGGDATPFLRAVCSMLSPQGYFQWTEIDLKTIRVAKSDSSAATPCLDRALATFSTMLQAGVGATAGRKGWNDDLREMVESSGAGLEVVHAGRIALDTLWYKVNMDSMMMTLQLVGSNLLPRDKIPEGAGIACREEWTDLLKGCVEEGKTGAGIVFGESIVALARKRE